MTGMNGKWEPLQSNPADQPPAYNDAITQNHQVVQPPPLTMGFAPPPTAQPTPAMGFAPPPTAQPNPYGPEPIPGGQIPTYPPPAPGLATANYPRQPAIIFQPGEAPPPPPPGPLVDPGNKNATKKKVGGAVVCIAVVLAIAWIVFKIGIRVWARS